MKQIIALAFLLVATSSFASSAVVKISGMVCQLCAQGIKKDFGGREEVQKVAVDMEKKEVHLHFKGDKDLDDKTITQAIKNAGFVVKSIKRTE